MDTAWLFKGRRQELPELHILIMSAHARAYIIGVDFALWAKNHVRKAKKVSMD